MKKHIISIVLGFLLTLLVIGAVSAATSQFTSVIGSQNPSSSGTAKDLASSQYVAEAIGVKYNPSSFNSIVDSELTSTIKQNSQMNIIVFGGPTSNSITKELVNSGKSKVNWATSNGQTEIISNAWGSETAKVFIVAGKDRTATEAACKEFASQIKAGTVAFIGSTPTPPITTTYTIQSTASTGGTISPLGTVAVNSGSSQTFIITPNTDYEIDDVVVDGESQGAISSYTFYNVNMYHYISASFTKEDRYYTITASPALMPGSPGYIDPSGSVKVLSGDSETFKIQATAGHTITTLTVDGHTTFYPAGVTYDTYTFTNVNEGHSISATFT